MDADFEQKSDTNPVDNMHMDDSLEREIADALGGKSVEEILDEEENAAYGHSETGVRKGRVISVQGDDIFVFFGGRTQGVLPASQFADEPLPAEGDVVEVTIEGFNGSEGLLLLSRKGAVLAATWDSLEKGAIVEGRVTGLNKGGLELKVGGVRAFMPISQVDLNRIEDLTPYLNRKLICEVTELDRSDNNVVVSAKNVLIREAAELKKQTLAAIQVDDIVSGTVRSIMPYGAFIDIGGIDGLLHVSDMSHSRVEDPSSIVQPGQQVEVKVLKINTDTGKISLGLKQTLTDPWEVAEISWPVGEIVSGKVTKIMDFGAFVELAEGVEGLIPMSEFTFERRIKSASDVVSTGEAIRIKVLSVDMQRRRISLSLKQVGDDPWVGASARWPEDAIIEGRVTRLADFGAFVELSPGVEGLIHISQLSNTHVRSPRDAVRVGDAVKAVVLEVDEGARRISLSIKALADKADYAGPASVDMGGSAPSKKSKRKKPLRGGLE